ncbi:hypothetical protein EDC04DRAFT_2610803 [Pisolithus marmoratus]|nr:hypothetical protein EDC04DRAFT_2610803 [Pisolithus marmoratus]
MLQLAHASRKAFAAQVRLRLTRIHELDVMRTIAYDEYEEALELLRQADRQIGEVRQTISKRGTTITTVSSLRLSLVPTTSSVSSLDGISNDRSPSASPSRLNGWQLLGSPSSNIPGAFPHSASGASSQLECNVYNTYVASNPSESSSITVNERLRAASGMISTRGKDIDVLQQHQGSQGSRAPSQEHLRAFGDALYAQAYASHQSSCTTSLANSSLISPRSDHSSFQVLGQKNSDLWRSYSARDQEVLGWAWHLMIYEMVTNIGWPVMSSGETARKLWKNTIHEVLLQASAMIPGAPTVELLSPTKGTKCLLMRTLTLFHADLASKAAPYVRQFFPNHNPTSNSDKDNNYLKQKDKECACITNASTISNFFMHEHDEEGKIIHWFGNQRLKDFHICFWYTCDLSPMKVEAAKNVHSTLLQMYAMSAVVLFYTIKRESKCVNETLPCIPFMGMEFSPTFEAYYNSLLNTMQHAVLSARLKDRFDWLHCQGLLIDSVTSTAGASGGGISNEQHASSSTGWAMDFQGFGPTYYDYDL